MGIKLRSLSLNLPFGLGGATIEISEAEARAAWALYVELSTRVAIQRLEPGQGSVREALNSMYRMFDITREVLREAGPEIADGPNALGPLAIRILNQGLRPFLVQWHTAFLEFEAAHAPAGEGRIDESRWQRRAEFDQAMERTRAELAKYAELLGEIAGVQPNLNKPA
jgi:hypothetical protein